MSGIGWLRLVAVLALVVQLVAAVTGDRPVLHLATVVGLVAAVVGWELWRGWER